MTALSIALSLTAPALRIGVPATPAPIVSTDADGWSAQWASGTPPTFTPDSAPATFTVARAGFDAAATATSHVDTRVMTRRRRNPYPGHATDTAATVALDDYVYATDTIAGVTNHSVELSPRPVAAWTMPSRLLVGAALAWELVAFHRDARAGRQVACVVVTATDGTTTVTQRVAATAISALCEDANPVEVYGGTIDISALADGLVTLNARVYPWIGAAASVRDSAAGTGAREFSPRYYRKATARAAAPPLAYVATTGNDTTGVWSTIAATAHAAPFASVQGAINAASVQSGVTGGVVDGCRIRIGAGTFPLASALTARAQNIAALVIERDPAVARADAIVQLNAAWRARLGVGTLTAPLTEGAILFRDLTVSRTANTSFQGEAGTQLHLSFWNVGFLGNGVAGTWLNQSHDSIFGMVLSGFNGNLSAIAGYEHRILRGLTADIADIASIEGWVTIGCNLTRARGVVLRDATRGGIWYANRYPSPSAAVAVIEVSAASAGQVIEGVAIVQNLIEVTNTTLSTPAVRLSSDSAHGDLLHVVLHHNTVTGYGGAGRQNLFYDESAGTNRRKHRLIADVGNIWVQINSKGDVFHQTADPAEAPNRTGQFAYHHGVGCRGNWSQFRVAAGTAFSESQAYPGLRSVIGTDPAVRNDPLFVDYRGTTGSGGVAVAGAGGGDYRLQAGSPARARVAVPVLAFDLAGTARAASDNAAGAFA